MQAIAAAGGRRGLVLFWSFMVIPSGSGLGNVII